MRKPRRKRRRGRRALLLAACSALLALAGPIPAQAAPGDPLFVFDPSQAQGLAFPPFEDPCGLAVDSAANLYVSDYYHHIVDVFKAQPATLSYLLKLEKVDPIDGPCGLGLDATGALYLNDYHRNVEKFTPSSFPPTAGSSFPVVILATKYSSAGVIDSNHPTGVAVDPVTGDVYLDARTEIRAYDSSGAFLQTIGQGSVENGYGLALSGFPATAGYLYVPDAGSNTVKVFDPATDLDTPVEEITGPPGGFGSLRDSAIAVDDATGEIYLADTLGPQFSEAPKATIQVFDATGTYEGQLRQQVIDGSPVGLAVDNSPTTTQGRVYVTSGNSENSVIYAYAPGSAVDPPASPLSLPGGGSGAAASSATGLPAAQAPREPGKAPLATPSSIAQRGTLRVSVEGSLAPRALPRKGAAPVSVSVGGEVSTTDQSPAPQLKGLAIELNKEGRIETKGLPSCPYARIQPASTQRALSACKGALVGRGSFEADISLTGQEPYPTQGKLLVFNAKEKGKSVLYGQIYAPRPFATSFVIVFQIQKRHQGPYGTVLSAFLPQALGSWGNLTAIEMTLSRRYSSKGRSRSYLSAGCPAPKGFGAASFPLARASFEFEGGKELRSVLGGTCRVRG